uniref:Uncharacterized protein n=1 Tax=Aeromonas hydrophila TaxID=644 RepID=Q6TP14_AERHY|nr:unknown [Aeromonas hydrophila]
MILVNAIIWNDRVFREGYDTHASASMIKLYKAARNYTDAVSEMYSINRCFTKRLVHKDLELQSKGKFVLDISNSFDWRSELAIRFFIMARFRTERFNVYLTPDELISILGKCGGRRNRVACFLRDAALGRTIRPPVNVVEGVTGLHVSCVMQLWDEQSVPL